MAVSLQVPAPVARSARAAALQAPAAPAVTPEVLQKPAPALVDERARKNAEATARLKAQILELLRHEAYAQLSRAAEAASPDEQSEEGEHCRRWYGFDLVPTEQVTALQRELLELDFARRRMEMHQEVLEIRGEDAAAVETAQKIEALTKRHEEITDQQAALVTAIEQSVARRRRALVQHEARRLYAEYEQLAEKMPFRASHPAVPEFVRKWAARQFVNTTNPVSRLYLYLTLRETIFHGANIGAPMAEERPVKHALERAGMPRNKREARDQWLLDRQFVHANGDRRVDRTSQLDELDETRRAWAEKGVAFIQRMDEELPDYDGTPVLGALDVPVLARCAECSILQKDGIRNVADADQTPVWVYQRWCDCTTDDLSPPMLNRKELEGVIRARHRRRPLPALR